MRGALCAGTRVRRGLSGSIAPLAESIPLLVAPALTRCEPRDTAASLLLRARAPRRGTLTALSCTMASTAGAARAHRRSYECIPFEDRYESTRLGPTTLVGKGGPTAFGVGTLSAATVRALVTSQAAIVPGGGASGVARDSRQYREARSV